MIHISFVLYWKLKRNPGPSLVTAHSHCNAHGIDMSKGADEQDFAVKSGYWPLFHLNPMKEKGQRSVTAVCNRFQRTNRAVV